MYTNKSQNYYCIKNNIFETLKETQTIIVYYYMYNQICTFSSYKAVLILNKIYTYEHFSSRRVCVCSPVLIMYFQTPDAALANWGRAYLICDGHVNPSSTFSKG